MAAAKNAINQKEIDELNQKLAQAKTQAKEHQDKVNILQKEILALDVQYTKTNAEYDDNGTIGKRYRRYDEIGAPKCITVDFDSLKDNRVTERDRDTMKQKRISIKNIEKIII